ncbi:MAG: hypothetical protein K0R80_2935 [Clostridia bacterium]|jgi:uncharacterized protein (DUF2164 family)|nr:hypothetical protein [Clostridia bacterium]MDF2892568.1 hypothetical protein [Clostridia bacterium]
MKTKLELTKEKKDYMISEIKSYFSKERDLDLGDLAAALILDFFIEKLAQEFYNQGVEDSYKYMSNSIEDLLGIQRF